MVRSGSAKWTGGLRAGQGTLSTESGAVSNVSYSFSKRFESEQGTNPEELIGAAHASCFSMALSAMLEGAGHSPESVETNAGVTVEKVGEGFSITKIQLDTVVDCPGLGQGEFEDIAAKAKAGCPVSRALAVEISLNAKLTSNV